MILTFLLVSVIVFSYLMLQINKTDEALYEIATAGFLEQSEFDKNIPVSPVKNTTVTHQSTVTVPNTPVGSPTVSNDVDDGLTIRYTDTGFVPSSITVDSKDAITFLNDSNSAMWITPYRTSGSGVCSGLDQGRSIGREGEYVFTFNEVGIWQFKNLNDNTHIGTVTVLP